MVRKIEQLSSAVIEEITKESLKRIGFNVKKEDEDKVKLLLRLIVSGIANHFFEFPDTEIDVGFMKFKKNPNLDELFTVDIIRNQEVVNASRLYKYYKGELLTEKALKNIVEGFVNELAVYSQNQNNKIGKLTNSLSQNSTKKRKEK